MIQPPENNLQQALERELDSLAANNAERLCSILHGLFACMKDLDSRLRTIEERLGSPPDEPA